MEEQTKPSYEELEAQLSASMERNKQLLIEANRSEEINSSLLTSLRQATSKFQALLNLKRCWRCGRSL